MKVFAYFVEPASYSIDLIRNIHQEKSILFCFIKGKTKAKSSENIDAIYLSELSNFAKIRFVFNIWKSNDLIIVNGYNNYVFIFTFLFNLLSFRKRFLATESDTKLRVPRNAFRRLFKSIYLSIIFQNKSVLGFAGGSKTHKDLFRHYGMAEKRIFLMPMVVDNQKYYHIHKNPNTVTFLFVGRLLKTKNVDVLCEKFISNFSDKKTKLIIVGAGDGLSKLEKKFPQKKIEFKGEVFGDDLIKIYQNSSVLVFPSTWEQWGLVVNEALASSLPVIAHKEVGSIHDLIIGKETGFVIENWEELEEKMLELFYNKELCNQFSENAVDLMKNNWNYDLYNKCLNKAIEKVKSWQ
ncbi:MAG: glycosyltransferase family 4 protein [Flavobacteriales bacterium]|nr:glycosyltransferase family 4 protein [Flavobacteriales bacterium]